MNESHQRPVGYVSQDFLDGKWTLDHIAKSDEGQISRTIPVFARAQPSAEPVAWAQSEHSYDPERHGMQRRLSWKKLESDDAPLYAHPPTDSAALRDAAIAELVRRKMTSGNSVPVERCIITAAEIEAIAQQEAP